MKILPDQLEAQGYRLHDTLPHGEIMEFMQVYLKKSNTPVWIYNGLNALLWVVLIGWFAYLSVADTYTWSQALAHMGYGVIGAFLLIPFHEWVHAVAYRLQGATHTSYDANWRKFYFMAMADQFVANRKEFSIVALAPFVTISALSLVALPFVPMLWSFSLWSLIALHTLFCGGDFGLLSYFETFKNAELVTYDDKQKKETYFYIRNE